MDRAGNKASQLSIEEMALVFELVARGGSREEARRLLGGLGRDRNTAHRIYNVVRELEARGPDSLDTATAQEIAETARYSTTASLVQSVHMRWRTWKHRVNPCQDHFHQEFLRDRLTWLMMELKSLEMSFLGVFRLSYRPEDSSNRLKWLEQDNIMKVEWELGAEQLPGWPLVWEHLESGVPEVARAVVTVKRSYGAYCQRLLTLEDAYRERAREEQAQTGGGAELNESHFYRSILAEVDGHGAEEEGSGYSFHVSAADCSVAFGGVVLIACAEGRTIAQHWVELHRRWRREMRTEHLSYLLKLRQDVQNYAGVVVSAIDELELGGLVPGGCHNFS